MFERKQKRPLESEDLRRMGRVEAEMESLQIKWVTMRDELLKLARRLEKRDERAEKKAAAEAEIEIQIDKDGTPAQRMDDVTTRVLARRNRHGVPG